MVKKVLVNSLTLDKHQAISSFLGTYGCNCIWFTAGTTFALVVCWVQDQMKRVGMHSRGKQVFDLRFFIEIAKTNTAWFTSRDKLFHRLPCGSKRNWIGNHISVFIFWAESVGGLLDPRYWPVDLQVKLEGNKEDNGERVNSLYQVEINIIYAEVLKCLVESGPYVCGIVLCVPQFACNLYQLS